MIRFSSTEPIYIQIANFYKTLIEKGAIQENEPLPSVRDVAISEGVNPNTVQKAFTILVNDGYLRNVPKKGFFANKVQKEENDHLKEKIQVLLDEGYTIEEIITTTNFLGRGKHD